MQAGYLSNASVHACKASWLNQRGEQQALLSLEVTLPVTEVHLSKSHNVVHLKHEQQVTAVWYRVPPTSNARIWSIKSLYEGWGSEA